MKAVLRVLLSCLFAFYLVLGSGTAISHEEMEGPPETAQP